MQRMSIKSDLVFGFGLCVILFVSAVIWGGPFLQIASSSQPSQTWQQGQVAQPDPSATFAGTIVKSGGQYCLRDVTGQIYSLDDPRSARVFAGKDVQITGQLDQQSMLIRVEQIRRVQS
jgi:uncharacterized protein YdeI (BOF family)